MSDLPTPEINPVAPPDLPAPGPDVLPPATPEEAPATSPVPDDGRPYDR